MFFYVLSILRLETVKAASIAHRHNNNYLKNVDTLEIGAQL